MIKPAPYYNDPQLKILLSTKPHKTFIGGRGVGKTTIIATTGGNVSVPGHEAVKVGLNIYKAR